MKKILLLPLLGLMVGVLTVEPKKVDAVEEGRVAGQYTYYYSDSYFYADSRQYNPSLATMSFVTSDRCFSNGDAIVSHLTNLGFSNPYRNADYFIEDNMDTTGVCIASKTINDGNKPYTLIAVTARPSHFAEWASNFTVGAEGEHAGFHESGVEVINSLNEYEKLYGSNFENDVKVWFAGYSRGASAINVAARMLTDSKKINDVSVDVGNIFAYGCEPASTVDINYASKDPASYTNIFNIINRNDLVIHAVPKSMGFVRYGIDVDIMGDDSGDQYNEVANTFASFSSSYSSSGRDWDDEDNYIHILESFRSKKLVVDADSIYCAGVLSKKDDGSYKYKFNNSTLSLNALLEDDGRTAAEFFETFFSNAGKAFTDRKVYTYTVEPLMRIIAAEVFDERSQSTAIAKVYDSIRTKLINNKDALTAALAAGQFLEFNNMIVSFIKDSANLYELDLDTYQRLMLQAANINAVLPFALAKYVAIGGVDDLISLFWNIGKVIYGHTYELCYSWLITYDNNYTDKPYSLNKCNKKVHGYTNDGTYSLSSNGHTHQVLVRKVDKGYTLFDVKKDSYIAVDEGKITYANNPSVFTYSDNAFSIKSKVYGTGTLSKYVKTTKTFYLYSDGGLKLSTNKNTVDLFHTYQSFSHTYECIAKDHDTHTMKCSICGDVHTENHIFVDGRCKCGRYSDKYINNLTINASVLSEKQTKKVALIKKTYYVYTINIAIQTRVPVTDFYFTINNDSKHYYSPVLVTETKISKIKVYLKNGNGELVSKEFNF